MNARRHRRRESAGSFTAPLLVLAFLALAFRASGLAQTRPEPGVLTMEQAVQAALARHPDILAARAEIEAAAARRLQAEARPDPSVALGTAAIPFSLSGRAGETEIELGIEQTFEFPGRRALRTDVARFSEETAALELVRVRLLLAARVRKAYLRVVLADRTLASILVAEGHLDEVIDAIQVRYTAGRAAYADVLRARVDRARLRNRAIEERRERQEASAVLNFFLGRPAGEPLRVSSEISLPPLGPSAADLKAALAERPSVRIAALSVEQAAAAERLAGLNGRPDLTAGLFVPSKRLSAWGFSLGLSLPLSGKRRAGERAEAAAERDSRLAAADGLRRRFEAAIDSAYESARLADEQVRVFELQLLTGLEDELAVDLELYALGRLEAYALIDLHRAAAEARLEYLRAVYNAAVARVDLDIAGEDMS